MQISSHSIKGKPFFNLKKKSIINNTLTSVVKFELIFLIYLCFKK